MSGLLIQRPMPFVDYLPVSYHVVGRVHCSGAPGRGRVRVGALVILNTWVLTNERRVLREY